MNPVPKKEFLKIKSAYTVIIHNVDIYKYKVFKILFSYIALTIAENYMSNVYVTDVLQNKLDAPSLMNFMYIYILFELVFNTIFIYIIHQMNGSYNDYFYDLLATLIMTTIFGSILTIIISSKKFFLYQDDGLRGIRSIKDILFYLTVVLNIFPYAPLFELRK